MSELLSHGKSVRLVFCLSVCSRDGGFAGFGRCASR